MISLIIHSSQVYVTHSHFRPKSSLESKCLIPKAVLDLVRGYTKTCEYDIFVIGFSEKKKKKNSI